MCEPYGEKINTIHSGQGGVFGTIEGSFPPKMLDMFLPVTDICFILYCLRNFFFHAFLLNGLSFNAVSFPSIFQITSYISLLSLHLND